MEPPPILLVMPGLVPGIHVFFFDSLQDADGGDKPGDDELTYGLVPQPRFRLG
jgi:hypothetical protein